MHLSRYYFVFMTILSHALALESGLFLRNDCPCPGYNLTFECIVTGDIGGATVWKGEVFQSSCMTPIFLRHREFTQGVSAVCSNDDVVLHTVSLQIVSFDMENSCSSYTSQLNISYSTSLIGSTIVCAYDNGTQVIPVDSRSITSNTKSYPPPAGIHLTNIHQHQFITFAWNSITPECSAFHYRIIATNCGICPRTTFHNTVTCVLHSVTTTVNMCLFAVKSVFCEDTTTGNISEPVLVKLRVPEPPFNVIVWFRYSYLTGAAVGFALEFTNLPLFFISDGVDGSALSYSLAYNHSVSGLSCGSGTVLASSCVDGVCRHSFTYEESSCNSPSTDINITISAANILGVGPPSDPTVVHSSRNTVFSVTFNVSTNSVICKFFNQQISVNIRSCHIEFGTKEEKCSSSILTSKSTSNSNIVEIGLPARFFSNNGYCFRVKGYDGTYTAFVEGTYNPGISHQSNLPITVLVTVIVSLISSGGIAILIAIMILILARANKKIRNSQPTSTANNPVYEEPCTVDHHVSNDQAITISDNVAYSLTNFQETSNVR